MLIRRTLTRLTNVFFVRSMWNHLAGRYPIYQSTRSAARLIDRTLTRSNTPEPTASAVFSHAIPMPTVAAGGTSATAIMTPTSADESPEARLITPAAPDPRATTSDKMSGRNRSRICEIDRISNPGGTRFPALTRMAKRAALAIVSATPMICSLTPSRKRSRSWNTVPTLVAIAGPMSGAITIDPTTTAAESRSSPAVAIIALTIVMPAYIGIDAGPRSLAALWSSSLAICSGLSESSVNRSSSWS